MPKSKQRQKTRPGRNKRLEKKFEAVQHLNPFVTNYIKKLESDNERMKTDPDTEFGKLIPQMREALAQNKRLSVLAATLIEAQGGAITVTKESLESFESKVLSIKWALPEGVESLDEATEYVFTYEAITQEEADARNVQINISSNDELTREEKAQQFIEASGKKTHSNDCATSVAPAEEPGQRVTVTAITTRPCAMYANTRLVLAPNVSTETAVRLMLKL